MKILAIEFSSIRRSVAVLDSSADAAPRVLGQAAETLAPTTKVFHLIETALTSAGVAREEIGRIAVGLGPGSYTGIRLAISVAQGWQLGLEVSLIGLSSLECLGEGARQAGMTGPVCIAIDAQRREFYSATYELAAKGLAIAEPIRLVPWAEIEARAEAGQIIIGPEMTNVFPGRANVRDSFPLATTLGELAAGSAHSVPGEALEPIYLREVNYVKAPLPRQWSSG